jgi:tRNA dimethylallyltransferase
MAAKPPLVSIVGPTASGKSEVSIELAAEFHGEIVSADSRQVYRGMDVGTNKPTGDEQAQVPHHLLDMAEPSETFTLAQFQQAAFTAIEHIQDRGRLPFLVGGTGLYIQAVTDNLQIPPVAPQPKLRAELDGLSLTQLQDRLKAADPVGYESIDTKNPRRLIRAIEVSETAGVPFSSLKKSAEPLFDLLMIGIARPPEALRDRILRQTSWRLQHGLVEEVESLHHRGVSWEQFESFGLEYRRVAEHLQGKLTYEEMVEQSRRDLIAFAKRQLTWFRKDKRIRWIETEDDAEGIVSDWLIGRASPKRRPAG